MIFSGFKFGMLLQLAIGPVCVFIFSSRVQRGFLPALCGTLGVVLTDGAEIALAILGAGALLDKNEKIRKPVKYLSRSVVVFFGIRGIFSSLGTAQLTMPVTGGGMFLNAVILAASNPLTIIFWTGVFAARIAHGDMTVSDRWKFGLGCVLSTLFFLTLVSLAGSITSVALPEKIVRILNFISGLGITAFGIRNFISG